MTVDFSGGFYEFIIADYTVTLTDSDNNELFNEDDEMSATLLTDKLNNPRSFGEVTLEDAQDQKKKTEDLYKNDGWKETTIPLKSSTNTSVEIIAFIDHSEILFKNRINDITRYPQTEIKVKVFLINEIGE